MASPLRVGFLGLGEVGFGFSRGLLANGMPKVYAFDVRSDDPVDGKLIRQRAEEIGVVLTKDREELARSVDVIIATTTSAVAVDTARGIIPFLTKDKLYADFNSASPNAIKEIDRLIHPTGARFVDGAIMAAISLRGHKAPIIACGKGADELKDLLSAYGMQITLVEGEPGTASALKMLRSVYAKGLEAVLLEAMVAAHHYGVDDLVFASICEFMDRDPFAELGNMLLTTNAIHSLRRSQEMDGVLETLREGHIDEVITKATRAKLQWSSDLGLREHFGGQIPKDYRQVLEAIASK